MPCAEEVWSSDQSGKSLIHDSDADHPTLHWLASNSQDLSGADLQNCCREAGLRALHRDLHHSQVVNFFFLSVLPISLLLSYPSPLFFFFFSLPLCLSVSPCLSLSTTLRPHSTLGSFFFLILHSLHLAPFLLRLLPPFPRSKILLLHLSFLFSAHFSLCLSACLPVSTSMLVSLWGFRL